MKNKVHESTAHIIKHNINNFIVFLNCCRIRGVQPASRLGPGMAMNAAQHKILIYLKYEIFFVITSPNVFSVWPETALLPVWPRDTKRLNTPVSLPPLYLL